MPGPAKASDDLALVWQGAPRLCSNSPGPSRPHGPAQDAASGLQAPRVRIWKKSCARQDVQGVLAFRSGRDMPESFGVYQNRVFAGRDEVIPMTIDRPKEVGRGNQATDAFIEAPCLCPVFAWTGFNPLHQIGS